MFKYWRRELAHSGLARSWEREQSREQGEGERTGGTGDGVISAAEYFFSFL